MKKGNFYKPIYFIYIREINIKLNQMFYIDTVKIIVKKIGEQTLWQLEQETLLTNY